MTWVRNAAPTEEVRNARFYSKNIKGRDNFVAIIVD
jgi:hypothetical protein